MIFLLTTQHVLRFEVYFVIHVNIKHILSKCIKYAASHLKYIYINETKMWMYLSTTFL